MKANTDYTYALGETEAKGLEAEGWAYDTPTGKPPDWTRAKGVTMKRPYTEEVKARSGEGKR